MNVSTDKCRYCKLIFCEKHFYNPYILIQLKNFVICYKNKLIVIGSEFPKIQFYT